MQFWNPAIPGYIRPDVDPPKRVTLATWGLLPTCKQALIILGAINLGAFSKSVASLFRFRREGLLSLAALQIFRRNFPRVGFIQSRTVLLMRRQTNPITQHETWLKLFWSKLCIFCGLYFDFVLSPVFKDKPLVGVLSSSIWVLYQGRIFLAATERKNITDLLCFEHAQDKIFDAIFCKVKKSSFFLSLAFGAENKKSIAHASRSWKNLISTCRQV